MRPGSPKGASKTAKNRPLGLYAYLFFNRNYYSPVRARKPFPPSAPGPGGECPLFGYGPSVLQATDTSSTDAVLDLFQLSSMSDMLA